MSNDLYNPVCEHISAGVVILDQKKQIISANQYFCDLSDYTSEELLKKHFFELFWFKEDLQKYQNIWEVLKHISVWQEEVPLVLKSGRIVSYALTLQVTHNTEDEIQNYIGIFNNKDTLLKRQKELHTLAYNDTLTKLPNRTLFFDRLQQSIARAERSNTIIGILFLDLDDFKEVNDSFGHDFGDMLLQEVAIRAKRALRKVDTIARFGGDEFVVLLEDIQSAETAADMAKRLITTLSEPISIREQQIYVSVSIGISTYPSDGGIAKILLKKADIAMYKAKESGKNQFTYYHKHANRNQERSLKLLSDLSRALEYNELFLVYQPQYSLKSSKFTGAEVLIRWQHPELGLISPVEFIPLAEMNGMINPITERIFLEVSEKFKLLEKQDFENFTLSVNISPRMLFEREFVPTLSFILDNYYLPTDKLRLEITENTFMKNMSELVDKLQQLKELGLHLEIDDYGTGFTSLNYLINLPIDTLKIDRCFITDIDKIPKNRAITSAMITIAHYLEMEIIAEGAETESEKNVLEELECDTIQGYYYSKPLTFDALIERLKDTSSIQ